MMPGVAAIRSGWVATVERLLFRAVMEGRFIADYIHNLIYNITAKILFRGPIPGTWRTLSSLDPHLGQRHVFFFRRAVKAAEFGRVKDVEEIFDHLMPPENLSSITVLYRANTYAFVGDWDAAARCVSRSLAGIQPDSSPDAQMISYLLRIKRAYFLLMSEGTLRHAVEEARSLRAWLVNVKLEYYSEATFQCVEVYHDIIRQCQDFSNWFTEGLDGDLPPTPNKTASASLTLLGRYLQDKNMLHARATNVRQEAASYDGERRLEVYEEFFHHKWPDCNSEAAISSIALIRISYAASLAEAGHKQRAANELSVAENLIRLYCRTTFEEFNPRIYLLYSTVMASVEINPSALSRIQQHREFARRGAQIGNKLIEGTQLVAAFRDAITLSKINSSGVDQLIASGLEKEILLQLLAFASGTGQIAEKVLALMSLKSDSVNSPSDAEWLRYCDQFERDHPNFDIPYSSERLYYKALQASRSIHNDTSTKHYSACYERVLQNYPGMILTSDGELEAVTEAAQEKLVLRAVFSEPNMDSSDSTLESSITRFNTAMHIYIIKVMIMWIKQDLKAGTMSMDEGFKLLRATSLGATESSGWVRHVNASLVASEIFGEVLKPTDSAKWNVWFERVKQWLKESGTSASRLERHKLLLKISEARAAVLNEFAHQMQAETELPVSDRLEALEQSRREKERYLEITGSLDPRAISEIIQRTYKFSLSSDKFSILALSNSASDLDSTNTELFNDQALAAIQASMEEFVIYARDLKIFDILCESLLDIAEVALQRCQHFGTVTIDDVFAYLEEAGNLFYRLSGQGFLLQAISSISASMNMAEALDASRIYKIGIDYACVTWINWVADNRERILADPEADLSDWNRIMLHVIRWTQKSKARALALAMGHGLSATAHLWKSMNVSSSARDLLPKYGQMIQDLNLETDIIHSMEVRDEMERVWRQMEADAAAQIVLNLARGRSIDYPELVWLSKISNSAVLVDWFEFSYLTGTGNIAAAVYRDGQLLTILDTGIHLNTVDRWVAQNLDPPWYFDAEQAATFVPLKRAKDAETLAQMNSLLKGLELLTSPGELLVFCPTQAMNRIPLHALKLGDDICIRRNPVVYCQSFTLLRMTVLDRLFSTNSAGFESRMPAVITPLRSDPTTKEAVDRIAATLGTTASHLDSNASSPRDEFLSVAADASLVHFHGHVVFDTETPMRHHLCLREMTRADFDADGNQCPPAEGDILTAQDLFGARLRGGGHVTTIGCQSQRAQVSKVNDHVGLVAALHCAGAASVISSLWNLHRVVGVRFSDAFYAHLKAQQPTMLRQSATETVPFVDMARACQHATLELMKNARGETLAPAHWAGLVLNGSWVLPHAWMHH